MISYENTSGKPLADADWLACHHQAKLNERIAFVRRLAAFKPMSIVDLGCASGLWLDLLNQELPIECEFIGIDSDEKLLKMAIQRSDLWKRKVSFLKLDLEQETFKIPPSDLTLAFNIFPYIKNLDQFITTLSQRVPRGRLAIRQYDGASIRFGPMLTSKRQALEIELRVATENSQKFRHYDLDRTYTALHNSDYKQCFYEFELFQRFSPFPKDFLPYYKETLAWTIQLVSKTSADYLHEWINTDIIMENKYFYEVDLVAILS